MPRGVLISVNVGAPRTVRAGERQLTTAIWKSPVAGRVVVAGVNLRGDDQADRTVHGGPDKAVYAYAEEDTSWWEQQEGRLFGLGAFGENLTTRGVDVSGARIGERWRVGSALLEVCQPRLPCFKLGLRHVDPLLPRRFARAGRPGAYLRIVEAGDVGEGDAVQVVERPDHAVTIAHANHVFLTDHDDAPSLLAATALPDDWLSWAADRAAG